MTTGRTVLSETRDGVSYLTLNRPAQRNAINAQMRSELSRAIEACDADPLVRAVVIRGAGPAAFCAGADIKEFVPASSVITARAERVAPKWTDQIAACRKPTIAAIHGYCLGGGLEIALACDIRIAATDAKLGLPEVRLGIIPGAGGTQRLPRVVGVAAALRMVLTGDPVSATEAFRLGLVSELVDADGSDGSALNDRVEDLVGVFRTQTGPLAVSYAKELVLQSAELPLEAGLRHEGELSALLTTSADRVEGATAFRERRAANYVGR